MTKATSIDKNHSMKMEGMKCMYLGTGEFSSTLSLKLPYYYHLLNVKYTKCNEK